MTLMIHAKYDNSILDQSIIFQKIFDAEKHLSPQSSLQN